MKTEELAASLRKAYENAPQGDKTLCVHLWGIEHAEELDEYRGKVGAVVRLAEVGDWTAALNDARKLAQFVTRLRRTRFWEYRLISTRDLTPSMGGEQYDYRHTEQEFIRLSAEGWEAVSIAPGGKEWVALLRRPTSELVKVDHDAIYTA